jgi:hypothetical protein
LSRDWNNIAALLPAPGFWLLKKAGLAPTKVSPASSPISASAKSEKTHCEFFRVLKVIIDRPVTNL